MDYIEKIAERIGYLLSYFLFATILFFALGFLNKLPEGWTYFHIMTIVAAIAAAGYVVKRYLYGNGKTIF